MVEIKGKHSEQSIDNVTIFIAAAIIILFISKLLKNIKSYIIIYSNVHKI
jgi:hypothetical protein